MDDQHEVIAFLMDGASYGAPEATVERMDTHASSIFLIADKAYKLKRAISYSYLDYSTPALREKFCRAEFRLNRRTAPGLYLGVHAITREPAGGLAFDGAGTAVDWVLELKRFDQDQLFDRLAEARRLTPAIMRELADTVAAFHADAEIVGDRGGPASLEEAIAGNHANLALASSLLDQRLVAQLHARSVAKLRQIGGLIDARREHGKVRRCHGDLHLRNVCLFQGRPTLFDCIEFNDAFSCIDVLYDLAFLLMDLVQRGLGDLANIALNRYLDRTGDSAGLPALPLFMSVRAAVRAHVMAALFQRAGKDGAGDAPGQARAYLSLALRLLEGQPHRLVAIGGFSGSGKSTVAQALAPGFLPPPGARVIRSDVLRKRLMNVAPETPLPPDAYTPAAARRVYDHLGAEAATVLAAGCTAIVDAAFLRPEERSAIATLAQRAHVPFAGLWLEAPLQSRAARVASRRSDASDADRAVLDRQTGLDVGPIDWHRIDASGDVTATIAAAARQIET